MSDTANRHAKCYCGRLVLGLSRAVQRVIHCHCAMCRRQTGAAFTTWVTVDVGDVRWPEGGAVAAWRPPTAHGTLYRCACCSIAVYAVDPRFPGVVGVLAGAVEGALPDPVAHYFVSHKAPWFTITDALPQFGGDTGFEPVGPVVQEPAV